MTNKLNPCKKSSEGIPKAIDNGFTLTELIVGIAVAGVVISSTVALTSGIHRSTTNANRSTKEITKTDSILNQIKDEIEQSEAIITSSSNLPSGCSSGGGNFILAFSMPPQAYGKSDYRTINVRGVAKTQAQQNTKLCPIVLGIRPSRLSETGPYTLYRYGPEVDDKGFYINTSVAPAQPIALIDGIDSRPFKNQRSCRNGWSSLRSYGFEACVDRYSRTALISVSRSTDNTYARKYVKRSAAASSRALESTMVSSPSTSGGGGRWGGVSCYLGQCGPCDGTTFLIDRSGSMGWGNNRMGRAKTELINAVRQCLATGGGRINVMWFTWGSHGSYRANTNVELTSSNINDIIRYINTFRAGGGTNPWPAINNLIQSRWYDAAKRQTDYRVKRLVILTDGMTRTRGSCFSGGYMSYADCYQQYNARNRPNDMMTIDSVAMDTSCSYWLQALSDKNGGTCRRA